MDENDYLKDIEAEDADYLYEASQEYWADKQGHYTLDDYYALPDDQRVELIDGYFYDMAAPSRTHQLISGEVHRQISNFILDNNGKCEVYIAPTDVQINKDNRTMVQPDVLILCHDEKIMNRCIYGAPEFILEVLSKSTAKKDKTKKVQLYKNAGVKEYWMLNQDKRVMIVYYFDKDEQLIWRLDKPLPIGIYDGRLKIDFTHVNEILDRYS